MSELERIETGNNKML